MAVTAQRVVWIFSTARVDMWKFSTEYFRSVPPKGLIPGTHRLGLRQFIDYDYVDQLSEAEAQWLADFSDENYRGTRRGLMPEQMFREQDAWRKKASEDVLGVPQIPVVDRPWDSDARANMVRVRKEVCQETLRARPVDLSCMPSTVAALSDFARTLRPEVQVNRAPRAPHLERVNREIIALNAQLETVS
jgi:hypothetical protein